MAAPTRRIVIGYNGTPEADLAFDYAARAAGAAGVLLEVVVVDAPPMSRGSTGTVPEQNVAAWHEKARDLLARGPVHATHVVVRQGPPVSVLLAAAATADHLVVGGNDRTVPDPSSPWPIAEHVNHHLARQTPCPLTIVRPPRAGVTGVIVVGVDDSSDSRAALEFAFEQALVTREIVKAVHVTPRALGEIMDGSRIDEWLSPMGRIETIGAQALHDVRISFPDVEVRALRAGGRPPQVFTSLSRSASMVVLGARGRHSMSGMRLGATTRQVLQQAECPVTLVRRRLGPIRTRTSEFDRSDAAPAGSMSKEMRVGHGAGI